MKRNHGWFTGRRHGRMSGACSPSRYRRCRFEQMETRVMLSASPIHLGLIYYEDATGTDESGDTFELTFQGGAPGTQLSRIIIDTDKLGDGLTIGDCFFDTEPGGLGAFGYGPFAAISAEGINSYSVSVADGGTKLILDFTGFDAGERFIFTIDVDEMGFLGPNAVAEGNEFEGSRLTAVFVAPHFYDATGEDIFYDAYEAKLAASGLSLPRDSYSPPLSEPQPVRTAGAFLTLEQTPLPVAIRGRVFEDQNLDVALNGNDRPLSGVRLELWQKVNNGADEYVFTGQTVTTDADGGYHFDNLLPGTYRVVERQPDGYLSVGARVGNVGGDLRGVVTSRDVISEITLLGGEESVDNDFAEVRPASLSGHVYHDANNNGLREPGEAGIGGVTLVVIREGDHFAAEQSWTLTTTTDGSWSVGGLYPGLYRVEEVQPEGYYDGLDRPGSLGGLAHNPGDAITQIRVSPADVGTDYDFGELLPASLSGRVYSDLNMNCQYDPGEPGIPGVIVELYRGDGIRVATAVTDSQGQYRFEGLFPDRYVLREIQPTDYFDGCERVGSAGGRREEPDTITDIHLASGVHGEDYLFGEIAPAGLAGQVFADENANDKLDEGDRPIAGVTIRLFDAQGILVATTTTDSQGRYRFANLYPGYYAIEEVQPEGYLDGADFLGTAGGKLDGNDRISEIKLPPAVQGEEYNFAEIRPASISGFVFQDGPAISYMWGQPRPDPYQLRDGRRTPDDVPLAGVEIQLRDARGQPVLDSSGKPVITYTDANGFYKFEGLRPGTYTVYEVQPAGYEDGPDTAGTLGGLAVNPGVDLSVLPELAFDPQNDAILFVTLGPGSEGEEYNFAEVLITVVPPFLPPVVPPSSPPPGPPPLVIPPDSAPIVLQISPALPGGPNFPHFVGGAGMVSYTWHLSVINGGMPRHREDGLRQSTVREVSFFDPARWEGIPLDRGRWIIADLTTGEQTVFGTLGTEAAIPVVGDFAGTGRAQIGIFFGGMFFIDLNGNGVWDEGDLWIKLGRDGDQPVAGDWDGDGKIDVGVFGPSWLGDDRALRVEPGLPDAQNRLVALRPRNLPPKPEQAPDERRILQQGRTGPTREDLIDHVFMYGEPGDFAVVGDWNGDGIATIGVFRGGVWYLDWDGDGRWGDGDRVAFFGHSGDIPVVGDWTGDGRTKLGIFRDGRFVLDTDGDFRLTEVDQVFLLGGVGDRPFAGDFNGDGKAEVGVYQVQGPHEAVPGPSQQPVQPRVAAPLPNLE